VIVNVSSGVVYLKNLLGYGAWYTTSKHALSVLSESVRAEVAQFDIRVICIEPGSFKTEVNSSDPFPADGPYGEAPSLFEALTKATTEAGKDPSVVAEAIAAAVEDPETPSKVFVRGGQLADDPRAVALRRLAGQTTPP
jgi:NAD(P)-dependent dehydrogenase (short-subunit alcohol dehydrogenase family)